MSSIHSWIQHSNNFDFICAVNKNSKNILILSDRNMLEEHDKSPYSASQALAKATIIHAFQRIRDQLQSESNSRDPNFIDDLKTLDHRIASIYYVSSSLNYEGKELDASTEFKALYETINKLKEIHKVKILIQPKSKTD